MFNPNNLSAFELDALNELGNIGVAHAAAAFGKAVNKSVRINVIRTVIISPEDSASVLGGLDIRGVALETVILGGAIDKIVFIAREESACGIAGILEGKTFLHINRINQKLFQDTISEVNAYYIEAVSKSLDFSLFPLETVFHTGVFGEILNKVFAAYSATEPVLAFLVEAEFILSDLKLKGNFILASRNQEAEQMIAVLKTKSFRE